MFICSCCGKVKSITPRVKQKLRDSGEIQNIVWCDCVKHDNQKGRGRPKGITRQSITLSLPVEMIAWLRSTGRSSQVVQEAVQKEIDSCNPT